MTLVGMYTGTCRTAGIGTCRDCRGRIDVGTRRGSVGYAEIASKVMSGWD
jgi:hypothetical protein